MSRGTFFVRYALPYIVGLMAGGLALKAVQDAGGSETLAQIAWVAVTVVTITAWVLLRRAIRSRRRPASVIGHGGRRSF